MPRSSEIGAVLCRGSDHTSYCEYPHSSLSVLTASKLPTHFPGIHKSSHHFLKIDLLSFRFSKMFSSFLFSKKINKSKFLSTAQNAAYDLILKGIYSILSPNPSTHHSLNTLHQFTPGYTCL